MSGGVKKIPAVYKQPGFFCLYEPDYSCKVKTPMPVVVTAGEPVTLV